MLYLLGVGSSVVFYLDKINSSVMPQAFILMYANDLSCCRILKRWDLQVLIYVKTYSIGVFLVNCKPKSILRQFEALPLNRKHFCSLVC